MAAMREELSISASASDLQLSTRRASEQQVDYSKNQNLLSDLAIPCLAERDVLKADLDPQK